MGEVSSWSGLERCSVTSLSERDAQLERDFRLCAQTVGVDQRLAALILDCERAMAEFPPEGDRRWYGRLEDQHRKLLTPDLRTIVAVTTRLAEETPALAPLVAATLQSLAAKRPDLAAFHDRLARTSLQARPLAQ